MAKITSHKNGRYHTWEQGEVQKFITPIKTGKIKYPCQTNYEDRLDFVD